jgi:hypothetical protein
MGQYSSIVSLEANRNRGNGLQSGATDCTDTIPVRMARAVWDTKTAEKWAHASGVQPRMVKYWLAGHKVSDAGRLALIRLLT